MKYNFTETIPLELISYKKILDTISTAEETEMMPCAEINRDKRGRIISANFYSDGNELYKQVFFDGDEITAINYYSNDRLARRDIFDKNYLAAKHVYKKDGTIAYEIYYSYNQVHQITSICKRSAKREILVTYAYDTIDRIICRNIYLNSTLQTEQHYCYDALNRVVEYKDENQRIVVKSISQKNELLSYSITDKINNEIIITNHFTATGYIDTEFVLNGHSTTVKDTRYVDNVMLRKPFTSEDDLDLIISGLYNSSDAVITRPSQESSAARNAMSLIDKNIELKVLPISIRKRVLYNLALKSWYESFTKNKKYSIINSQVRLSGGFYEGRVYYKSETLVW